MPTLHRRTAVAKDGENYDTIADRLNMAGVLAKQGGRRYPFTVRKRGPAA